MICKVNENISWNTYFDSANSAVVFDWKPDRLPPKKGHLLKETFATDATNLSLVWQDTRHFGDL